MSNEQKVHSLKRSGKTNYQETCQKCFDTVEKDLKKINASLDIEALFNEKKINNNDPNRPFQSLRRKVDGI